MRCLNSSANGSTAPYAVPSLELTEVHELSADLITDYVSYADRFELPPIMHELTIITGIAALANGKVTIKNGDQTIPLDFWTLLISGSGAGRNTLASVFRDLLKACDKAKLVSNDSWGSGIYMREFFANHPTAVFHVWEEMSAMMQKFTQKNFLGALEWLTNLCDNFETPSAVRYRTAKSKSAKTPDIVFSGPPRTNFLSLTSEAWFLGATNEGQAKGGFTAGWSKFRLDLWPE